jgi:phospholipid transport system transporter-binding protein
VNIEVAGAEGTFAVDGDRWRFSGQLVFSDAAAVFSAMERIPLPASCVVDFGGLAHADSSALAVLLALKRRAAAEHVPLHFVAMPAVLQSLARVYDIEAVLAA